MAKAEHLDRIGRVIHDNIKASCTIYVYDGIQVWTGSGFLVARRVVVTNAHVVYSSNKGSVSVTVTFDQKKYIRAEIIGINYEIDVAILFLSEDPKVKPVKVSYDVTLGEIIAVIGSPGGWHDVASVGRVTSLFKNAPDYLGPQWNNIFFIDADIEEGSSGSMVVDINGNVIGMVMGMIGKNVHFGRGQKVVIPMSKITSFIIEKMGYII